MFGLVTVPRLACHICCHEVRCRAAIVDRVSPARTVYAAAAACHDGFAGVAAASGAAVNVGAGADFPAQQDRDAAHGASPDNANAWFAMSNCCAGVACAAVGANRPPPYPSHDEVKNWNSPDADELGLCAVGLPPDSQAMIGPQPPGGSA